MLKKTLLLTLFLFLSSCGYEPIHSKKNISNYDFSINKISFKGDRDINLKIKEKLNNYTLIRKEKNFSLNIISVATKTIQTKNLAGDPTSFKKKINIKIQVIDQNKSINNLTFEEDFNYNNSSNKYNLRNYEREIKNNLTETATDKLIFKLSNIK
jgi:hypothetical protein|tara:strand:- start:448 stop:912 length:465 start_codon:yes stop_codon:yes gene_type:complete